MRFKIKFTLHHEKLDADYRPVIVSFIKNALSQNNEDYYKSLYGEGAVQKPFAFAPYLPAAEFNGDTVQVNKLEMDVLFTTPDYRTYICLYNAFLKQRHRPVPLKFQNSMTLESIVMLPNQIITKDSIIIKLTSPLVIRSHNIQTNQDTYLTYNEVGFESAWRDSLYPLLAPVTDVESIENLQIKPMKCKKVVVRIFGQKIDTTLGTLKLEGKAFILNYLFSMGMGSRRSQGFGVFNVIA